jgi:hypothetical protein
MRPLLRRGLAVALFACAFARPGAARAAGEIQLATGPGAYATSWRGDGAVGQALKVGYRFADLVAIDGLGRVGYGTVDQRILTYLSLGATLYGRVVGVRPYARAALVHQHEEPFPAVRADPLGALFGVGDGIRHRSGLGSSLGVDIPVHQSASKKTELVLGIDANGAWFVDPRGPTLYYGGALWAGLNFGL